MQVSTFEVLVSTSKFMYSASFDILPQSIEDEDEAGTANLHPHPHGNCGNEPSSRVE